tara:strand:+ start:627 stop:866 length:240 start_codon:yes stop_codon:yes gene_type:complete
MYLSFKMNSTKNGEMRDLKNDLKAAIIRKYETVEKWANANEVLPSRFYNFIKGNYNPTVRTLEYWLDSVDLELTTKKKK